MISFHNVSKQFFNKSYGVKNVSFVIEPGEMVLLTGPTGSGKTTLMRLMIKEYDPTEGEIIFEGTPLSDIHSSQLHHHRRRIGVVFQDYRLLPEYNMWENIALPLSIAGHPESKIEERVTDLLKLVHLEDKADLFPQELSGGEEQRVSIARALATAPPVLFADEPTGNLDPETSQSIVKLLHKINEMGTTVIVATHDVVVMDLAKDLRKLHLDQGELVTDSNPKNEGDTHPPTPTTKKDQSAKKKEKQSPEEPATSSKADDSETDQNKQQKQSKDIKSDQTKETKTNETKPRDKKEASHRGLKSLLGLGKTEEDQS